jgi:hypothetical protein
MNKMKTLTLQGVTFEVVDEQARADVDVLKENSESGGGASSWNDLTDKPFGEEKAFEPIVWDGNTEGKETFYNGCYVKMASYVSITDPSQVERFIMKLFDENGNVAREDSFAGSQCVEVMEHGWAVAGGEYTLASDGQLSMNGIDVPEGVWGANFPALGLGSSATITILPSTTTKPLDEKYLPESVKGGGGADLLDENGIIKQEYLPEGFPYRSIADPVILPSTTLTADPDSGTYTIPDTINTIALSADVKCVVKFEVRGYVLKFEVTPQEVPENDQGFKWALGNTGLLDGS